MGSGALGGEDRARWRVDVLLFAAALLTVGPIVAPWHAQSASRLSLTAAVAERHSVDITGYPLGVDYSVHHGRRSDKAPGQPVLAAPLYVIEKAVGAEPASHFRRFGNLTQWWITFWSSTVPFALLLVLMRRHAARYAPGVALPVTLAFGAATLLLPLAANLFGHMLAATLGFAAWTLLDSRTPISPRRLLGAGALAGLAVFVEYEAAIVVAVLAIYALVKYRRDVSPFIAGAAPGALALAFYESRAFGAPWKLPYSTYIGKTIGTGHMRARLPFAPAVELLVSPLRGLIITSPLVLVALFALWLVLRNRHHPAREHALVALGCFAGVLVVVATFDGSDLAEIPGPRFLLTALPFLVTPLAIQWNRVARVARPCVAYGVLMNAMATWTFFLVGHDVPLWRAYPHRIGDHAFNATVWSLALGRLGIVCYVASIVAIVVLLAREMGAPKVERAPLEPLAV